MKWESNRGHVFDEKYKLFKLKDIYVYGAGDRGKYFYDRVLYCRDYIRGFIDKDKDKECYCEKTVISPDAICNANKSDYIIVVCLADSCEKEKIFSLLDEKGYKKDIDCFDYEKWIEWYQYIYVFEKNKSIVAPFISMQFTTVCNLRCRGCVACNPQIKKPHYFGASYFESNLKSLFNNIDFADRLDVCGGEPFIGNKMIEILQLFKPYRNRINKLSTVTNGTVIPSDDLCKALSDIRMVVKLDDYSDVIREKTFINEIIAKFNQFHVLYEVNKVEKWIYLGWEDNKPSTDIVAKELFEKCNNMRKSIHNQKLFVCDYAGYANEANVINCEKDDYIDLVNVGGMSKSEMLEFLLGYNVKGYCAACKYCNGGVGINEFYIPVAEQMR